MPDLQKVNYQKEKILSIIRTHGPSFPARISRETGISPLFAAAFLSEMLADRKLKLSNLKVGSSPLYFIEGQEPQLEKFVEHLPHKEREAFHLLKGNNILDDEKQEPAIRVALRKIKDFAMPINVRLNEETKLFWKFFTLTDDETRQRIEEILTGKQKREEKEQKKEKTEEKKERRERKEEKEFEQEEEIKEAKKEKPKIKKTEKFEESEFAKSIKEYLGKKDIEILQSIIERKKEFVSKISIKDSFGRQEFYLISKDKKKISTNDLTIALQQAQVEKMPALFLSSGELDKKAQDYLKEWRNLIKFEQVKI